MKCQAIQLPVSSFEAAPKAERVSSKVTLRGLVEKYVQSLTNYWRRQNAAAYEIDRAVLSAREEIFLKYGHLMMK